MTEKPTFEPLAELKSSAKEARVGDWSEVVTSEEEAEMRIRDLKLEARIEWRLSIPVAPDRRPLPGRVIPRVLRVQDGRTLRIETSASDWRALRPSSAIPGIRGILPSVSPSAWILPNGFSMLRSRTCEGVPPRSRTPAA